GALAGTFGLARAPQRVEVYDNSHIQGTNAVGAMVVAGSEGFRKNQYRKFNIKSTELTPGDDYGMMREVLSRRFKRLLNEAPRAQPTIEQAVSDVADLASGPGEPYGNRDDRTDSPWPDLVVIDGGEGQLKAAEEILVALGVADVPLVAIAKGPD